MTPTVQSGPATALLTEQDAELLVTAATRAPSLHNTQPWAFAVGSRHGGVGRRLVAAARDGAGAAGCEWLHVDFADDLAAFYLDACGFQPARAGLLQL